MGFMKLKTISAVAVALAISTSASAADLIVNGSFSSDSQTIAHEFGASFTFGQTVTGWQSLSKQAFNVWEPTQAGATGPVNAATRFGTAFGQYLWTLPSNPDPDGGAFLVLDGDSHANGAVQQMVTGLTVGTAYTLSFDWAAAQFRSRVGATTEEFKVDFGGDTFTTALVNNASKGATPWVTVTHTFTATSTSELLSFLSIGTPQGLPPVALLDGVHLTPPTITLHSGVPEPTSWALMILGFTGLGAMLRRRRTLATA
jgi:hapalindole biogenesis HpiC1 cyclase-like protein/PEP-CTERM motif-containing protein